MDKSVYDTQRWRDLPRSTCIVEVLFGDAADKCGGRIDRHHIDKEDPGSRTVEVCLVHHPMLEAILDRLLRSEEVLVKWKRCPHKPGTHRYPGARAECERNLNRHLLAA